MSQVIIKKLIPMFMDIREVLNKNNIPFWLEGGTLLGMIRDKQIMPWDDDLDIATFRKSFKGKAEKISKELYDKGFNVYTRKNRLIARRDDESISLFLYDSNGNSYVREGYTGYKHRGISIFVKFAFLSGLTTTTKDFVRCKTKKERILVIIKNIMLHIPTKKFFLDTLIKLLVEIKCYRRTYTQIPKEHYDDLDVIPFYGTEVYIPKDAEGYLAGFYGENWRIPVKEWSPKKKYHYPYRMYKQ